ncbi:MAG: MBL fold metallo-hydrolase [Chloroflexi bacterium]|nr:MBL fold metallo-hydrolase [Chloroflexota bacterium]
MTNGLTWLGHASFRLETSSTTVYFDPWQIKGGPKADLILVTHEHHDHLSIEDIDRLSTSETEILCSPSCLEELAHRRARAVHPGERVHVAGIAVEVVPAYNTDKPNHPQSAGHVGYIVESDGRRIYHAGDTDVIPEMEQVRCDVALLPMGGTYTMNADQAAQAAARIGAKVVVPMHWGRLVGTERDVERMQSLMPEGARLIVLSPSE